MKTRIGFGVLLAIALATSAAISLPAIAAAGTDPAVRAAFDSRLVAPAVVAAILLQVVAHLVRSEKHAVLLREIRPIGRRQVFRGQMIGLMFNALLPLRIGEIMRAHYVGRAVEISRSAVLATIVLERCIDLVAVLGVIGVVVALDPASASKGLLVLLIAAVVLLLLAASVLAVCYRQPQWFLATVFHVTGSLNERLRDRARHIVWSFCYALRYAVRKRTVLARYLALSFVMWGAYLGSIAVLALPLRHWRGPAEQVIGAAAAPYLGVTSWRGLGVLAVFRERTSEIVQTWLPADGIVPFAVLAWAVLVVPGVVLGAIGLLHRQLVQHLEDADVETGHANKLFRDVDSSEGFAPMLGSHFRGEHLGKVVSREEALGRFTVVKALKGGSHAATLLVWQNGRLVVKKVSLLEHGSKLQAQYDWLRSRAAAEEIVDVIDVREAHDYFSIDIGFREGYIPFFEHLHATSPEEAWATLERMLDFVDSNVYEKAPSPDQRGTLDSYIRTKAVGKLRETASVSPTVHRLLELPEISVNGERMLNFGSVLDRIRGDARAMNDLRDFGEGPIHGDLTIDNMMVHPFSDEFMIIDPNNENAISDPVVDYAKLLQSLHSGYEFLLLHDVVAVDGASIRFEERRSAHYQYLHDRLMERLRVRLPESRYRSLVFHEAIHYCRMLTYRAEINPGSVALYYGIAVRLLNGFYDQYRTPYREASPARGVADEQLVRS